MSEESLRPAAQHDAANVVVEFEDRIIRVPRIPLFAFDEYATRASAIPPTMEIATDGEGIEVVSEEATEEVLVREALMHMEKKIDAAIDAIVALQRRIESIRHPIIQKRAADRPPFD